MTEINESDSNENNDENATTEFEHEFRTELPKPMVERSAASVWAILKQCVDKVI